MQNHFFYLFLDVTLGTNFTHNRFRLCKDNVQNNQRWCPQEGNKAGTDIFHYYEKKNHLSFSCQIRKSNHTLFCIQDISRISLWVWTLSWIIGTGWLVHLIDSTGSLVFFILVLMLLIGHLGLCATQWKLLFDIL